MVEDHREEAIKAMNEHSPDQPDIPIQPSLMTLGEGWEEEEYTTGEYGLDDKEGIEATFKSGKNTIQVLPVEFRRSRQSQEVLGLTKDMGMEKSGITDRPPVDARTAYSVHISYRPMGSPEQCYYAHTADAGDALAIACWISQFSADGSDIQRLIETHGSQNTTGRSRTDGDRIDSELPDDPNSCIIEGKTTRSHMVDIPFRYGPLLDGFPTNHHNVPCVPETVESIVGAVSHSAWEAQDLSEDSFSGHIERVGPGEYALDEEVTSRVEGINTGDVAIHRFGE